MRITFVTPGLTLSGGMLAVVGFANGLAARGHQVTVVAPRAHYDTLVHSIDRRIRLAWTRSAHRGRPSHVLSGMQLAIDLAMVVPRSDALIATYAPTTIPVLLASALGRGAPLWYYADYEEMFATRPIERWIIRALPRRFSKVMTNSYASVDELASIAGISAEFVGLGLPRWDQLGPPPDDFRRPMVVLYVGDTRPRKGLMDFLEAGALAQGSIPDLQLVVATKDDEPLPLPISVERLVKPDDATLTDLYRTCGVFVSTSWSESLGLPPLEAMACAAPVVVTNQRGARDYAVDGENCVVVPIKTPERVANAIVRVLGDSAFARRISRAGLETAKRYHWQPALDRFERVLSTSVEGRGASRSGDR